MTISEITRLVADAITQQTPERNLTRIVVMVDGITRDQGIVPPWWRVGIGINALGVTEAIAPDDASDPVLLRAFIDRLFAHLDARTESAALIEAHLDVRM